MPSLRSGSSNRNTLRACLFISQLTILMSLGEMRIEEHNIVPLSHPTLRFGHLQEDRPQLHASVTCSRRDEMSPSDRLRDMSTIATRYVQRRGCEGTQCKLHVRRVRPSDVYGDGCSLVRYSHGHVVRRAGRWTCGSRVAVRGLKLADPGNESGNGIDIRELLGRKWEKKKDVTIRTSNLMLRSVGEPHLWGFDGLRAPSLSLTFTSQHHKLTSTLPFLCCRYHYVQLLRTKPYAGELHRSKTIQETFCFLPSLPHHPHLSSLPTARGSILHGLIAPVQHQAQIPFVDHQSNDLRHVPQSRTALILTDHANLFSVTTFEGVSGVPKTSTVRCVYLARDAGPMFLFRARSAVTGVGVHVASNISFGDVLFSSCCRGSMAIVMKHVLKKRRAPGTTLSPPPEDHDADVGEETNPY
ncbi:hypothetical protein B0H19DRAFT_1335646 [Mycena capillaripes]|nr:hypothetical protein B0H19DRAFT_1335646 [Mycena capillaripes]